MTVGCQLNSSDPFFWSWIVCCALALGTTASADNRVLVIGIDGAGGGFLNAANTPNIDALVANGAARFDYLNEGGMVPNPPSGYGVSGPNWSTILTGASVAHHGVVDNTFSGSRYSRQLAPPSSVPNTCPQRDTQ